MEQHLPRNLLRSRYRKELWADAQPIVQRIEKVLPISALYVMGSFTSKKRRPADIDFIVVLNTPTRKRSKWLIDLCVVPDNAYGQQWIRDLALWMKRKYGAKKTAMVRLR